MSLRRLAMGFGATALDKVVVTVVQLLMVPVLVHAWGLALFGIWAMISTVPVILGLSDFGLVMAAWSRMTRFMSRGEIAQARATLHTAWSATVAIALVLAVATVATVGLLPDGVVPVAGEFGELESRLAIAMLIIYGLLGIVFRLNAAVIRAGGDFPLSSLCTTAFFGLENLSMIAAVLLGADPVTAIAVLLALKVLSLAVIFVVAARRFPAMRPGFREARRAEWAELWRPALQILIWGVGFLFFIQASVVALGVAAGAAAVPAFVAVRTLSRVGLQASGIMTLSAAQEFAHEYALGEHFRAGRYFGLVAGLSFVMALGMGAGMLLLARPVLKVWTGGAIEASPTLIAFMAISSAAAVLWNPLANLLAAVNRQKETAYASLAACVAGLALIAVTGPYLGATSAGIALALFDVALTITVLLASRDLLREAEFNQGVRAALASLRAPVSTWRSLRKSGR